MYRNILGGCFRVDYGYTLSPNDTKQESTFVNWLANISASRIKLKKEIDQLNKRDALDKQTHDKIHASISEELLKTLGAQHESQKLELSSWAYLTPAFRMTTIDKKEYEEIVENIQYDKIIKPEFFKKVKK